MLSPIIPVEVDDSTKSDCYLKGLPLKSEEQKYQCDLRNRINKRIF